MQFRQQHLQQQHLHQPARPADAEMAGPFPPDLHDVRHLKLKAGLLLLWALVSFVATYFARDLQSLVVGGWPLGYWIAAQGAVVVFIGIVVVYCWAMNRFERQDAEADAELQAAALAKAQAQAQSLAQGQGQLPVSVPVPVQPTDDPRIHG